MRGLILDANEKRLRHDSAALRVGCREREDSSRRQFAMGSNIIMMCWRGSSIVALFEEAVLGTFESTRRLVGNSTYDLLLRETW
jgi:hypothetical protein